MAKHLHLQHRPGVVATITVLAVTGVVMAAFLTLTTLSTSQLTQGRAVQDSEQAYYAAEAGINQALFRLVTDPSLQITPITNTLNSTTLSYTINSYVGTPAAPEDVYKRSITSIGTSPNGAIRTINIVANTNSFAGNIPYAAQAGAGGIQLDNTSQIVGDVYSNSNIGPIGGGVAGSVIALNATYPGNVWAVGTVDRVTISSNLRTNIVSSLTVGKHVYYQNKSGNVRANGGSETCTNAAGVQYCHYQTDLVPVPLDLAIRDDAGFSHIQKWIDEITDPVAQTTTPGGGCPSNTYCVPAGGATLGNKKIGTSASPVDLLVGNGRTLTLTGTLYVTGKLITGNGATVNIAGSGPGSVVIISEGLADIDNGSTLSGSTNPLSFIIFASRSTNVDPSMTGNICRAAICASNNSNSVVFASPKGMLRVKNNGHLKAGAADSIYLSNNSDIIFNPNISSLYVPSTNPTPVGIQPGTWNEL